MRRTTTIFFLGVLILFSCDNVKPTEKHASSTNTYYNIDSLLDAQIYFLTQKKALLNKKYEHNELQEEVTMKMDSADWISALSLFRPLDLNNPSLKEAYAVVDPLQDSTSNLTILQYRLKEENSQQQLKALHFYYLDSLQNLKKIVAESASYGFVYNADNLYTLIFDQSDEQTLLKTYSISTSQKTLFLDSVNTHIDFEVIN